MTLNFSRHKNILLQILKDIYSDTSIAPYLGFKGGTAMQMDMKVHGLPVEVLGRVKELLSKPR
jgi:hypothetical protein